MDTFFRKFFGISKRPQFSAKEKETIEARAGHLFCRAFKDSGRIQDWRPEEITSFARTRNSADVVVVYTRNRFEGEQQLVLRGRVCVGSWGSRIRIVTEDYIPKLHTPGVIF